MTHIKYLKTGSKTLLLIVSLVFLLLIAFFILQFQPFQPKPTTEQLTGPYIPINGTPQKVVSVRVNAAFFMIAKATKSESQIAVWYEYQSSGWVLLGQQTVSLDLTSTWTFPNGKPTVGTYRYYVAFYIAGTSISGFPIEKTNELAIMVTP